MNQRRNRVVSTAIVGIALSLVIRFFDPSYPLGLLMLQPVIAVLIMDLAFTVRRMRAQRRMLEAGGTRTNDELASLKAELAMNPEIFEQKILATRVEAKPIDEQPAEYLPTLAELIEQGRDPEEVGQMLADGKARR